MTAGTDHGAASTAGAPHGAEARPLLDAAGLLQRSGVMSATDHINGSVRTGTDTMLLTGTGVVHDLSADTLAGIRFDGTLLSGSVNASTRQIVGMHTAVYRACPDAGSVLHTHSPHLLAFALANQPLPCRYEALMRRGQTSPVPVVPWAPRGSDAVAAGVDRAVRTHPGSRAVLLANHGVLVWGRDPEAAAKLLVTLEEAAAAELRAAALGGARDLPLPAAAGGAPA